MDLARLKVPPQDRLHSRFATRTAAEFEAWLDELPRGDAHALGAATCDALVELNRSPLARSERYPLVELMRPLVNDACAMLVGLYKNTSFPLPEAEYGMADLVRRLYAELATGYKICVNEQLAARQPGRSEFGLQLATQRAILALGRTLLESYRVYAAEPPLLWRDLHTLYRNSELTRQQSLPIEPSRDSEETALSIRQAYLRVAVLAMANPYHLMQGEADALFRRIGRWVHLVRIRPPDEGDHPGGCFMLDLASDLPARYLPRDLELPPPGDPRLLELDGVVAAVGAQIDSCNENLAKGGAAGALSARMQRDMYVRFRAALGGREERTTERKPTVARLALVEGLSGCHFFLNGRRPFTPEEDQARWEQRLGGAKPEPALKLKLLNDDELDDAGSDTHGSRASRFEGRDSEADDVWRKADRVALPRALRSRRNRYQALTWNRKNESSGGIALFCAEGSPAQARVGELVIYADDAAADPPGWRVGRVCWLRTRANGGLELGIKQLAESGYAAGTQAVSGAGRGAEYLRGIVLPRVNPLANAATLITPAAVYDLNSVLRLNMKQLVIHVELTELIETTSLFTHFRFRVVAVPRH